MVHVPAWRSKDNESDIFLFPQGFGRRPVTVFHEPRANFSEAGVNCKVDHVDGPEENVIMDLVAVGRHGVVPHLACSGYNHHIAEQSMSPSTIRMRMRRVS